ncbi:MAG: glutamyl-tRNA reductase [Syntrophales bacterium]|nr:glutamyl-tRNA reductase [Syntrophales bacterium]
MNIVILGMNHKTAPLALRERLTIACEDQGRTIEEVKSIPEVKEALYLATCNRVEVLANVDDVDRAVDSLREFIFSHGNLSPDEMEACLYRYRDEDAVRHIFRVASSLDSMVMGEPQILGQVKDAYRVCVEKQATGIIMNRLLHHTFRVAKRVRTETGIAENAVSVGYTAVALSKKILGSLEGRSVLLVGAGEMAELAARHLKNNGVAKITVANRTLENARALAGVFGGAAVGFDSLPHALGEADIIITSTGSPGYIIDRSLVASALRRRRNRLLFLIDIAVPRDIDPSVGDMDNVYLYNIDDLQQVVDENMRSRLAEARKAEGIIDEEVINFIRWKATLEVVPTIVDLKSKVESITRGELDRSMAWMSGMGEEERNNVETLIRTVTNKILHEPVKSLKEECENGGGHSYIAALRRLFGLEETKK